MYAPSARAWLAEEQARCGKSPQKPFLQEWETARAGFSEELEAADATASNATLLRR